MGLTVRSADGNARDGGFRSYADHHALIGRRQKRAVGVAHAHKSAAVGGDHRDLGAVGVAIASAGAGEAKAEPMSRLRRDVVQQQGRAIAGEKMPGRRSSIHLRTGRGSCLRLP